MKLKTLNPTFVKLTFRMSSFIIFGLKRTISSGLQSLLRQKNNSFEIRTFKQEIPMKEHPVYPVMLTGA